MTMGAGFVAVAVAAAVCAGVAGACAARIVLDAARANRRRRAPGSVCRMRDDASSGAFASDGFAASVLALAVGIERRSPPGAPVGKGGRAKGGARSEAVAARLKEAGLAGRVEPSALRAAQIRLSVAGAGAGAVLGALLSLELALLLGAAGAALGFGSVPRAVRAERDARRSALERDLPEMLEVVALGLRSGLSFDRSFALYHGHFETVFAAECASAQRRWALALSSREQALRDLAASYDSSLLARVVESAVRSLRFGTSLAETFESSASEARAVRKARREERIAKAPVKMMLPTGTLILPAMLVLVLGPVLLELMGKT